MYTQFLFAMQRHSDVEMLGLMLKFDIVGIG